MRDEVKGGIIIHPPYSPFPSELYPRAICHLTSYICHYCFVQNLLPKAGSIFATFECMKKLIFLLMLLCSVVISAQTKFYKGDSKYDADIAYTIIGGTVYHGDNTFSRKILFTISDNKVYLGQSTSTFDCIYTVYEGNVYRGDSRFSSDLIYTIEDDKVYRGNSTFSSNCILTYEEGKIYMGDSTFPSDVLFTLSNDVLSLALIACIVGPY